MFIPQAAQCLGITVAEPLDFIFRYVSLGRAMGWLGGSFGSDFVPKPDLRLQDPNAPQPEDGGAGLGFSEQSKILPKGAEYHSFISYRWQAGQYSVWTSLIMHFNMQHSIVWPTVAGVICWFLMSLNADPENAAFPPVMFRSRGVVYPGQWWFNDYVWTTLSGVSLLYFSSVFFSRRKLFVDKFCINQHDGELQRSGLVSLRQFLARSQNLVCVIDDQYFSRLWCLIEIALYIKARKNPKVHFANVYIGNIVLIMWVFWFVISLVRWVVMAFSSDVVRLCVFDFLPTQFPPNAEVNIQCDPVDVDISWWIYYFFVGVFDIVWMFYFGRMYIRNEEKLKKLTKTFDVRKAQCSRDDDRVVLLHAIEMIWGDNNHGTSLDQLSDRQLIFAELEEEQQQMKEQQQQQQQKSRNSAARVPGSIVAHYQENNAAATKTNSGQNHRDDIVTRMGAILNSNDRNDDIRNSNHEVDDILSSDEDTQYVWSAVSPPERDSSSSESFSGSGENVGFNHRDDDDISPGVRRFNLHIRKILRDNVKMSGLRRLNIFPYAVCVGTFNFYMLLDQSSINWFPMWDARNFLHTNTAIAIKGFLLQTHYFFFYSPLWGGSSSSYLSSVLLYTTLKLQKVFSKWFGKFFTGSFFQSYIGQCLSTIFWCFVFGVFKSVVTPTVVFIWHICFNILQFPAGTVTENWWGFKIFVFQDFLVAD